MWALRRASTQIKYRGLISGTTRINCPNSVVDRYYSERLNAGVLESRNEPPDMVLFPAISYNTSSNSTNLLVNVRAFCSEAGAKSQDQDDDLEDAFSDPHDPSEGEELLDEIRNKVDVAGTETSAAGKKMTSELTKALLAVPTLPVGKTMSKWVEEGNELTQTEITITILNLRDRQKFSKAFQENYASRVDLIAKVHGVYKAEEYISYIPEAFQGEIVYRVLLKNFISSTNVKKSEEVFDKMNKSFPLTSFSCCQMLLLYKRIDRKKMHNILSLMERKKIKLTPFIYHILMDVKGQAGDISNMDQVFATMESEGFKPTTRIQLTRARHYANNKMKEKSEEILRDVENGDLVKNRWACHLLLPVYAILGNEEEVNRIWKACEPNPQMGECLAAIKAFGQLKRIEDAESVFDKISKNLKHRSSHHYTALIKIYSDHKMLDKGNELAKKMMESGFSLGRWTWDALVKLYVEAGEVEKADLIIKAMCIMPLPTTYMKILGGYADRGDIHNAEKIFLMMKKFGYTSCKSYCLLLCAYINAKVPAYGFRERLKGDNVTPNSWLNELMAQLDALNKSQSGLSERLKGDNVTPNTGINDLMSQHDALNKSQSGFSEKLKGDNVTSNTGFNELMAQLIALNAQKKSQSGLSERLKGDNVTPNTGTKDLIANKHDVLNKSQSGFSERLKGVFDALNKSHSGFIEISLSERLKGPLTTTLDALNKSNFDFFERLKGKFAERLKGDDISFRKSQEFFKLQTDVNEAARQFLAKYEGLKGDDISFRQSQILIHDGELFLAKYNRLTRFKLDDRNQLSGFNY